MQIAQEEKNKKILATHTSDKRNFIS